jgi:RecA-family ATPase
MDDLKKFTFLKPKDYLALPRDPQPWLIEKLVPSGGSMNLFGLPKLGKSFCALGIAMALADPNVHEWLGHRVLKHGPVLYLQVDTPRSEWAERVKNLNIHEDIRLTDANLVPYPLDITLPDMQQGLKAAIQEIKPIALIVDTLREVHDGDENDSTDMKKVITSLVVATKETNTALILVSHSRKATLSTTDDDVVNEGRGSGYTAGKMDMLARLTSHHLIMKGRSIGLTKISVQQDDQGMITRNESDAQSEANIEYVLGMKTLKTERQQSELLAAMDGVEPETARSRLRAYKKKYGPQKET